MFSCSSSSISSLDSTILPDETKHNQLIDENNNTILEMSCGNCPTYDSNNNKSNSLIVAKCGECNCFLCSKCLIEHQGSIFYTNHNIESLSDCELKPDFEFFNSFANKENNENFNEENNNNLLFKSTDENLLQPLTTTTTKLASSASSLIDESDDEIETRKIYEYLASIINKINETYDFCERSLTDKRNQVIQELFSLLNTNDQSIEYVDFVTNLDHIKLSVQNTFGYLNFPMQNFQLQQQQQQQKNDLFLLQTNNSDHFNDLNENQLILNDFTREDFFFSNQKLKSVDQVLPAPERSFLSTNSKIYRSKMQLQLRFGGMGVEDNRFTEPNGITMNALNDFIIADSNSNLVKVFDSCGNFKYKFGQNKLLFPNRVACHKQTGDLVIIERKPAHEVKIFNANGEMIRRFGSGLLKSPRGLCIDRNSRIIILESKVMRVLIFDMKGIMLRFFDVAPHFDFANSICTSNDKDEIFISDNHLHCIKVFNYEGKLLRVIGGPGLTNYPTSVDINPNGELLITDNYNSFNLTILTQTGELVNAFESKLKHARILDVAILNNQTIAFTSRDNHVYTYNYSSFNSF